MRSVQHKLKTHGTIVFLGLLIVAGTCLRLFNMHNEPLWGDEILSLDIYSKLSSLGEIVRYIRFVEFHPPLYYILMHWWTDVFGTSNFAIRFPSLMFSVGLISLVYYFAQRLFSNRVISFFAASAIAVLPVQIEFGQEARPYSMICFFSVLAAYALWRYVENSQKWFLVLYIISALLGLYTHYSTIFVLIPLSVWWLYQVYRREASAKSKALIIWLVAHAVVVLGFSYWLDAIFFKVFLSQYDLGGLSRNLYPVRTPHFFEEIFNGLVWMTREKKIDRLLIFGSGLAKGMLIASVLVALRTGWSAIKYKASDNAAITFLLVLLFAPALLFLFSPHSVPYTTLYYKHIIFITIPFVMLAGFIISRLPFRAAFIVGAVFFLSIVPFSASVMANDGLWDPGFQLQTMGEYISNNYQPGDLVLIPLTFARTDLTHFLPDSIPVAAMQPTDYYDFDLLNDRHHLGLLENEYQVRVKPPTWHAQIDKLERLVRIYNPKRIWLVRFDESGTPVHQWFSDHSWRHGVQAIEPVFLLDMYARP